METEARVQPEMPVPEQSIESNEQKAKRGGNDVAPAGSRIPSRLCSKEPRAAHFRRRWRMLTLSSSRQRSPSSCRASVRLSGFRCSISFMTTCSGSLSRMSAFRGAFTHAEVRDPVLFVDVGVFLYNGERSLNANLGHQGQGRQMVCTSGPICITATRRRAQRGESIGFGLH